MTTPAANRRLFAVCIVGSLLALVAAACGGSEPDSAGSSSGPSQSQPTDPTTSSTAPTAPTTPSAPPSSSPTAAPSRPITIAFAGDVHFESFLAGRLAHPETAMGPMAGILADADLSIVNLETAVTTRGAPQVKEFTFRAPPVVFTALKDAGIDVVTMANNHGLDYGPVSVPDALAAADAAGMPVIGIGENAAQAYRPWVVTVHGQRVAFLAASAVVDPSLIATWSATDTQGGIATALDGNNAALVAAVKAVRGAVDTVVVDLHYGSDLLSCPTEIQRKLASDLVAAGADIVVGQHAHILLGGGYRGTSYVDFGLGNFQFYVSNGSQTAETGVLTLTVDGRKITNPHWTPGRIVNGLPTRLTGEAATQESARWASLRPCGDLTATPQR